jgi:alkanesulfonate monooxygenase SsuD/methylene tetrahydromethanopterin reductase-like flavin-dependent oxidoreductase (luciferase family)
LAALAEATSRIRVGLLLTNVGFRHPAVLAKMAATLDVISDGRLEFGIGAGYLEPEYRMYGIPFPSASVRIAQAVPLVFVPGGKKFAALLISALAVGQITRNSVCS